MSFKAALNKVCTSVEIEPVLLPLSGEVIRGNQAPEARLDVSAIGFWRPQERMFADVRVFEPNCVSYKDLEPAQLHRCMLGMSKRKNANTTTELSMLSVQL